MIWQYHDMKRVIVSFLPLATFFYLFRAALWSSKGMRMSTGVTSSDGKEDPPVQSAASNDDVSSLQMERASNTKVETELLKAKPELDRESISKGKTLLSMIKAGDIKKAQSFLTLTQTVH
jgi:hypothetical protein